MEIYRNELLEFAARDLTVMDLIGQRMPVDQHGAIVTEVKRGSWAALGGLQANDIILSLNGTPTPDLDTFEALMTDLETEKPKALIFFIQRPGNSAYIEIIPEWPEETME
jgi:S1-C subfamily serine protease